jgi:hypothetical protein
MCLDVLRALKRDEEATDLYDQMARKASALLGKDTALLNPVNALESEAAARITVGRLAALAAADALTASAPPAVTEAFVRTRLVRQHAALYGADGIEARTAELLLQRALPER